jgi:hypothetical protein
VTLSKNVYLTSRTKFTLLLFNMHHCTFLVVLNNHQSKNIQFFVLEIKQFRFFSLTLYCFDLNVTSDKNVKIELLLRVGNLRGK